MQPEEKSWTVIVHLRGAEGLGLLHDDESRALADIADLGGTVSRVGDTYLARLSIEADTKSAAQAHIETDLREILTPYEHVRAILIEVTTTASANTGSG